MTEKRKIINKEARSSTIKIKINGLCVNRCVFCQFNSDPSLLEVKDIEYFFSLYG